MQIETNAVDEYSPQVKALDYAGIMQDENSGAMELYGQLLAKETRRCESLIEPFLADVSDPSAQEAFGQMARLVGELGARMSIFEQALEEGMLDEEGLFHKPQLFGELSLEPEAFKFAGLHGSERDEAGALFRWTRLADIEFELPIYRARRKVLQIHYSHIIKPEYRKSVRVEIDGSPVRVKARKNGSGTYLECVVPPFQNLAVTHVKCSLPAVHAPSEISESVDSRSLGIALKRISVQG